MDINDIINSRVSNPGSEGNAIDKIEVTQSVFQETEPYLLSKSITGNNIYTWNKKFIYNVMESFSTTIVQNFSKKEKKIFDRYTNFLINGIIDINDEEVRVLDEYIGTIKGDYV